METARALGCDEDEAAFDEKLKKLVPPRERPPTPGSTAVVVEYEILPGGDIRRLRSWPIDASDAT